MTCNLEKTRSRGTLAAPGFECYRRGIEIRILRPDDLPVLATVAADVFDDPIDPLTAEEFLRDPRYCLAVAIDASAVVGFVSAVVYVHPDKPRPELWINEVGVSPMHQRRGIGRQLLDAVLTHGRKAGCSEAWVLTDRDNQAAMRLYAAAGGNPTDQVMVTFPLTAGDDGPVI